jgi:hypothetical protein
MLFYLFLNQYVKLFLHESVFAPGAVFSMAFFGLCENRPFHDDCSSLFVFADKNPARKDFVLFIINAWIFSLFAGGNAMQFILLREPLSLREIKLPPGNITGIQNYILKHLQ